VGINGEYYTINGEYLDYTVRAETDVLASGNKLRYYIADNDGLLPPGVKLTQDGRIYGYTAANLKLDSGASQDGGYDTEAFDRYPYEHGILNTSTNIVSKPKAIKKFYEFYVTVTDGISSSKRLFSIEVVDPDSLRVDNTYIHVDTNAYDTSAGYLLAPLWRSKYGDRLPPVYNLGTIRASREQVISLYDYDPYPTVGPVSWDWNTATVNPEIKLVTNASFNNAQIQTTNKKGDTRIYFKDAELIPVAGMKVRLDEYIPNFDTTTYTITYAYTPGNGTGYIDLNQPLLQTIPDSKVFYVGTPSEHPTGMYLDSTTGQLYGNIPYQPAYSRSYRFSVKVIKKDTQTGSTVYANQIFILTIKGDIESYIKFVTTSSLGTVIPGQFSELVVVAENVNTDYNIEYQLVSGQLPNGLTLNADGSIVGRVAYKSQTYFDFTSTATFHAFTLDGGTTSIDQNWYFTVRASDVYRLSAVDQTCWLTVYEDSPTEYTRMYVKPFMYPDKRSTYRSFITDTTVFDRSLLYRPADPEFGVQPVIKMVIETGIEKTDIKKYVDAMQSYFSRKRFYFGEVKSILAQDDAGNTVYELVYVDIVDSQMLDTVSPSSFTYTVGSQTYTYYPTTVGAMQSQLESIEIDGDTILVDDRLQPRYMTTLQPENGVPLGFIKAVPICYALPGKAEKILSRIKSSGFDFKQFDFDTDRLIVETPAETTENGWLAYPIK